jgi:hypothetical protein
VSCLLNRLGVAALAGVGAGALALGVWFAFWIGTTPREAYIEARTLRGERLWIVSIDCAAGWLTLSTRVPAIPDLDDAAFAAAELVAGCETERLAQAQP